MLKPQSTEEVANIVRRANQDQVKLHPVSRGKNWGYGSSSPYEDGTWILDLSQMNQILDYQPELNTVRIQPGVTQKMLAEFLRGQGGRHIVPTTGAGGDVSLLGNSLERGYGLTPWSDHFLSITSIEAVLPSGEIYHSPLHSGSNYQSGDTYRWGVGPYLDGLFSQSDLGIVTEATLVLQPRTDVVTLFYLPLTDVEELHAAIPKVKELFRNYGSLIGGINFINQLRVLSMITHCSQDAIRNGRALTSYEVQKMGREFEVPAWTLIGTLYTNSSVTAAFRRDMQKIFVDFDKHPLFCNQKWFQNRQRLLNWFPVLKNSSLATRFQKLKQSYQIFTGEPSSVARQLLHWRSHEKILLEPFDPDNTQSGLLWYAPIIALRSSDLGKSENYMTEICRQHGFDPLITYTMCNDRHTIATLALTFSRSSSEEVERAHRCYAALFEAGNILGYRPYRYGILNKLTGKFQYASPLHQLIKQAMDPTGVLSPGRFIHGQTASDDWI